MQYAAPFRAAVGAVAAGDLVRPADTHGRDGVLEGELAHPGGSSASVRTSWDRTYPDGRSAMASIFSSVYVMIQIDEDGATNAAARLWGAAWRSPSMPDRRSRRRSAGGLGGVIHPPSASHRGERQVRSESLRQ
jgi:hypothetical protein